MGADLITYICFGPRHFSKKALKLAHKEVEVKLSLAKELVEIESYEPSRIEELNERIRQILILLGPGLEELYQYNQLGDLVNQGADSIIEQIVTAWDGCADCASRDVPNPTRGGIEVVVVAGDMTWGGEPEGTGYQGLKFIDTFGLNEILGVC